MCVCGGGGVYSSVCVCVCVSRGVRVSSAYNHVNKP